MLDIKLIREDPEMVRKNLEKRHDPVAIEKLDDLIKIGKEWREVLQELNDSRKRRNPSDILCFKVSFFNIFLLSYSEVLNPGLSPCRIY